MTAPIMDRLIDPDTGVINLLVVAEAAQQRAIREWGGPNPSINYRLEAEAWCFERADNMRKAWHRQRGLPVPGEEVLVTGFTPDWGSSGDSYGRRD